ncbi:MAG TPA: phosphoribosylglycinamide synthetase C domain-containing protein, partial [Chloroflexota bacterium]
LQSSLFDACASIAAGTFDPAAMRFAKGRTYGVVLAAPGYPEAPRLGLTIHGLDAVGPNVQVFHAGTARGDNGQVVTAGGRVLTVVGSDLASVYRAADLIQFDGKQLRRDIGVERVAAGVSA